MDLHDLKLFATFYIEGDDILSNKEKIQLMEFVKKAEQNDILYLLLNGQMPGEDLIVVRESTVASAIDLVVGGLSAGQLAKPIAKAGITTINTRRFLKKMDKGDVGEKPWGFTTLNLAGVAVGALATSLALKTSRKRMKSLLQKCEREKGMARKVCYNKAKRDGYRMEITALNSMKTKCKGSKNPETCIKYIDKRIKLIQGRMDSIKVF